MSIEFLSSRQLICSIGDGELNSLCNGFLRPLKSSMAVFLNSGVLAFWVHFSDHFEASFCSKFLQVGQKPNSEKDVFLSLYVVGCSLKMSHKQFAWKICTESAVLNLVFSCAGV